MESTYPELESFRQRWREEMSARTKSAASSSGVMATLPSTRINAASPPDQTQAVSKPPPLPSLPVFSRRETSELSSGSELPPEVEAPPLGQTSGDTSSGMATVAHNEAWEPFSALEHYETAVEKEAQGQLGDSLKHYRRAYKVGMKPRVRSLIC